MKILLSLFLFVAIRVSAAEFQPQQLVGAARLQIGVTVEYDPAYHKLAYPNGDVPQKTGVCCDVVVRALRAVGIDLQKEVHEDMTADFAAYPSKWGLKKPDANIDHRRVPNLMTYFQRKGFSQPISKKAEDYMAGDIVTWDLGGGMTHIGIVSDKLSAKNVPLVIHNMGNGTREEDWLFGLTIIGHYRVSVKKS